MLIIKSRLIVGGIFKIIKKIFSFIFKAIIFLNLQYILLVGIVGIIFHFTGVFVKYPAVKIIFYLVLGLIVFVSGVLLVRKIIFLPKRKNNDKALAAQEISVNNADCEQKTEIERENENIVPIEEKVIFSSIEEKPEREEPVFYAVKGREGYVMAEFSDRYELYAKTPNGLNRIRVDYK